MHTHTHSHTHTHTHTLTPTLTHTHTVLRRLPQSDPRPGKGEQNSQVPRL